VPPATVPRNPFRGKHRRLTGCLASRREAAIVRSATPAGDSLASAVRERARARGIDDRRRPTRVAVQERDGGDAPRRSTEMRQWHEEFLAAVGAERGRLASRRGLLAGGAAVAAATLVRPVFAQEATPGAGLGEVTPEAAEATAQTAPDLTVERDFADDIDVLNYALTLEHLENAFYRDGVGLFDFGLDPFGNSINDYLLTIGQHEATHVATLTEVITALGGTPVTEQAYDFSAAYADPLAFLQTAQALENVGVSAYAGAGAALSDPDLLTAAGTIAAVEGLHASYLNVLNNELPAPQPFETPLSRDEVLELAAPFLAAGAGAAATDETAATAEAEEATTDATVAADEAAATEADATVEADTDTTAEAEADTDEAAAAAATPDA